jgi:arylsulfatase
LEPYGFSEWNDWGDIDGGAWAGLQVDPVIAGQAAGWLRNRAPSVSPEQPWFMAVNFVNPHDIMSFDYGGRSKVQLPPGLSHAVAVRPPADIPMYAPRWDIDLPASVHDDLSGAAPAVREYAEMMDITFGPVAGDGHWVEGMNFYLNCIRDVDRSIEIVLDALEASGEADHTIVVFTADHGDLVGSHGLRQKGNLVYDENFHVPFIICHPDVAPPLRAFAGVDADRVATEHPAVKGQPLGAVLEGGRVRDGVLTAVESVTTLDAGYWRHFGEPDVLEQLQSGRLRPDMHKRGFLRGYTDERYTFGRYFSPLDPNRPGDVDALFAHNDVVLYDRLTDPSETMNLAAQPDQRALVATYNDKLEALISAEVGEDLNAWVTGHPQLVGPADQR